MNFQSQTLSEQKIAKVVALFEELRRYSPQPRDRVDELAKVMARPADPQWVIDAVKETRSRVGPRRPQS